MGRPRFDVSRWNPDLTLPENATILGVGISKAYYLSMRYELKFKFRPRGTKPGHIFQRKQKINIAAMLPPFSGDTSCSFGMGEGAD